MASALSWGEDSLWGCRDHQEFLFVILIQPLHPASGWKAPFQPLFASFSSFYTWEPFILEPERPLGSCVFSGEISPRESFEVGVPVPCPQFSCPRKISLTEFTFPRREVRGGRRVLC